MKKIENDKNGNERYQFAGTLMQALSEKTYTNSNGKNYKISSVKFINLKGIEKIVSCVIYEDAYNHPDLNGNGLEPGKTYLCTATIAEYQGKPSVFIAMSHISANYPDNNISNTISLYEILQQIVHQYNKSILAENRLKGLIADLMPNIEKKYLKILKQAVDDGIGAKLLDLEGKDLAVRIASIATIKANFKNNNAFTDTADYIIDCFLYALVWLESPPKEKANQILIDKLSLFNEQLELTFSDGHLTKDESKSLFMLAKSLSISENEAADLIQEKIKAFKFIPDKPPDKSPKSAKDLICARIWKVDDKFESVKIENKASEQKNLYVSHFISGEATPKSLKVGKNRIFFRKNPTALDESIDAIIKDTNQSFEGVKIGIQIWMKRNLNVSYFKNGDFIPEVKTNKEWQKASIECQPAWCFYKNDPELGKLYGKLYNWFAVIDPRGIAPIGWHVPSDNEWSLLSQLQVKEQASLKSKDGWEIVRSVTDEIGFDSLPGGYRDTLGNFSNLGKSCHWWSSTERSSAFAWRRSIYDYPDSMSRSSSLKTDGFSVRCLMDIA